MRAASTDLRSVVRKGGGASEWIWKGAKHDAASIEFILEYPNGKQPLRHVLSFSSERQGFKLQDERIENKEPEKGSDEPYFYYRYQGGHPAVNTGRTGRHLARESVDSSRSILAQRRDPEAYPELTYLSENYENIRIYREWTFGRNTVFREPQQADTRNDQLEEDFSNLGLFLNRLRRTSKAKNDVLLGLQDLYEGITDFDVSVEGGSVQVFFIEGEFTIPATRLSDGTLRYLCLLAILCDPEPPPLICIEEPELGLHPDILPKVADLLVSASNRTQLIVTTHSDVLVDALSPQPESVVIFEKDDGKTITRRLQRSELAEWLEKYRLGQLWTKGQLGGTRW
jgi:predicted ATPase